MTFRRLKVEAGPENTRYTVWSRSQPGGRYVVTHIHKTDTFGCVDADTGELCQGAKYRYPCSHINSVRVLLGIAEDDIKESD